MDKYFVHLCWKNIWRNRRRTLITINAIALGVAALTWLGNYYDSFHEQLIRDVIRYHSGHVMIVPRDFKAYEGPKGTVNGVNRVLNKVARDPAVRSYSEQILVQGLVSSPRGSANIWFKGVDPRREAKTSAFARALVKGEFLVGDERPIIIGERLSETLKVGLGSKVVALTQGVDGSIGNQLFRITGIFKTGTEYDNGGAFILLKDARSLLSLRPDRVHQVAVVLHSKDEIYPFIRRLGPIPGAKALSWSDVQTNIRAIIDLNKGANRVLMLIILGISALGIANSILMSIMERTREFGVMMAIGTSQFELKRVVLLETIMLSLLGVGIGNLLGIGFTAYFGYVGFDLTWLTDQEVMIHGAFIETISYPSVSLWNSVRITVATLVLSVMVAYLPVRHVSRLKPLTALSAR